MGSSVFTETDLSVPLFHLNGLFRAHFLTAETCNTLFIIIDRRCRLIQMNRLSFHRTGFHNIPQRIHRLSTI